MDLAFNGLGLAPPTRGQVLGVVGLSLPEAFGCSRRSTTCRRAPSLSERYKSAFPKTGGGTIPRDPLFPGARDAVEALIRRDDIVLGIATGKSRRGVDRLLDQEGWHGRFVTIQTADDHPSKPHPSMIERRCARPASGRRRPSSSATPPSTSRWAATPASRRSASAGAITTSSGSRPPARMRSLTSSPLLEAALDRLLPYRPVRTP